MAWKKEFTKNDAYYILTAGLMMLLMFPFITTNYTPFIVFDIIGFIISMIIMSAGIYLVWKTRKTTM